MRTGPAGQSVSREQPVRRRRAGQDAAQRSPRPPEPSPRAALPPPPALPPRAVRQTRAAPRAVPGCPVRLTGRNSVRADGAGRRPVADQMHARIPHRPGALQADTAARLAQPQRCEMVDDRTETGRPHDRVSLCPGTVGPLHAVLGDPREHRQPLQHPCSRARRTCSVIGNPVTETTLRGGSPSRTRSSTIATAARPRSSSNGPSRKAGGRRVTHTVPCATSAISIRCCTAEVPPPTTTTRLPSKAAERGPGYCAVCSCRPRKVSCPGTRGQNGRSQVPVALITARADQSPSEVRTSSRPPSPSPPSTPSPASRTSRTSTGRRTRSPNVRS